MRLRTSLPAMLAASLLAGCSSIFGGHHVSVKETGLAPFAPEPAGYAAAQLAQGRQALRDEQYGVAIIAFRNAQRFPEVAAAAANGLGVAYAAIGRADVAEHYFEMAVTQAPDDPRFAANLGRLRFQLASARASAPALDTGAASGLRPVLATFPGTTMRAGIRVEEPAAKLTRVSQTEVQVGTPDAVAPAIRRRASTAGVVATGDAAGRRRNPGYPVRIELAPRAMADAGERQAYPVRIAF